MRTKVVIVGAGPGRFAAASSSHHGIDDIILKRRLRARPGSYEEKSDAGLERYSERALARVWKAERFSGWMTTLLHRISENPFDQKVRLAELDYLFRPEAAATVFAENYVGLPF